MSNEFYDAWKENLPDLVDLVESTIIIDEDGSVWEPTEDDLDDDEKDDLDD